MDQDQNQPQASGSAPAGFPNDPTVPDIYAEGVAILTSPVDISLVFNRFMRNPPTSTPVGTVRMSPQQALITMKMIRKSLISFEKGHGKIHLAEALQSQLEISEEI